MHLDDDRPTTRITGVGVELPSRTVSSTEVEERAGLSALGFPAGWLERITGVRERRWAEPDVRPSDLAAAAARRAISAAGVAPDDVDALIFCGITRDFIEPATANVVQALVGATNARVFDLTNACNGVIDGLDVADALIRAGKARRVVVSTGERATISMNLRPRNPDEVMQSVAGLVVGDGGGALVVEASDDPGRGLRERVVRSDGRHWALAVGGRFRPTTQACEVCGSTVDLRFLCHGRELFEVGLAMMPPTMEAAMARTGWQYDDLDLVLCHEASKRFVETGMADLGDGRHPGPKIWSTVERFGNTSTVSLPLAMSEALAADVLRPGVRVLALGGSSGVSMAAMTLVW